uniref:Uncharacterized protein n=1 Tax=Arundo donax TaxID=35708 RepID=A0A0A9EW91_ARUDO
MHNCRHVCRAHIVLIEGHHRQQILSMPVQAPGRVTEALPFRPYM